MTGIRIEVVDALDCRVVASDWPFARDNAAAISRHWQEQLDAGRKLWNGRVLVAQNPHIVRLDGLRVFRSDHFQTDFAAFLAFRDFGFPDPAVRNCFAMAALRSADGAFLLARMGAHTSNAGKVYFAAGTPDPDDIRGDVLDLAGSVGRELEEETGLTAADVTVEPGFTLVFDGGRVAVMQTLRANASASDLIARVGRFVASEADPEIEGLVPVWSEADLLPDAMPDFILAYLRARLRTQLPDG